MSNTGIPLNTLLPHAYPFLLIDRVVKFEAGKRVVCIKNVSCNEDVFQGCLPDKLFFPSVLIIEAMAQTSGLLMAGERKGGGVLSLVKDAKFHRIVRPGEQLRIQSALSFKMSPLFMFEAGASVDGELVAEAEITLALIE